MLHLIEKVLLQILIELLGYFSQEKPFIFLKNNSGHNQTSQSNFSFV